MRHSDASKLHLQRRNTAQGGRGGRNPLFGSGHGGNGGNGLGGAVGDANTLTVTNCTLSANSAVRGLGGTGKTNGVNGAGQGGSIPIDQATSEQHGRVTPLSLATLERRAGRMFSAHLLPRALTSLERQMAAPASLPPGIRPGQWRVHLIRRSIPSRIIVGQPIPWLSSPEAPRSMRGTTPVRPRRINAEPHELGKVTSAPMNLAAL